MAAILRRKIGATTWFIERSSDKAKLGTINYPGTGEQKDKSKKYHAVCKFGENFVDLDHWATLDLATNAILTQRGIISEVEDAEEG